MGCPRCGQSTTAMGNPVKTLYAEVFNDTASWTDAIFWMIMGGFVGAVSERALDALLGWWC